MQPIQTILAAQDTDYAKVIFAVVFFLIWAVSQAVSVIAKKSEEARRRRLQEQSLRPSPPTPKTTQPARVTVRPNRASTTRPPTKIKSRQAAQAAKQLKIPGRPVAPPPIPRQAPQNLIRTEAALSSGTNAGEGTEITSTSKPVKRLPNASAPALHTWLRPATLRQQFILTEIFQPPLGLRDPSTLI